MRHLILGGARSGKSQLAERLAQARGKHLIYVATAQCDDEETRSRIMLHQRRRGSKWALIEEPLKLAGVLQQTAEHNNCILIDCLTHWLSNLLYRDDYENLHSQIELFVGALQETRSDVILVSNTVNMGITPLGEVSRKFVDLNGEMEQRLSEICECVSFVVAGLEMKIKA